MHTWSHKFISYDALSPHQCYHDAITKAMIRSRTLEYKGELVDALVQHAFPKFEDGTFRPIIDNEFPLAEAGEAHAFMESNGNIGKVLLEVILNCKAAL